MPCHNEADHLVTACESLGFGETTHVEGAALVLVNNASTDATRAVADRFVRRIGAPAVVVDETRVGHVVARRSGVRAAATLALEFGERHETTLIIQADADAMYSGGYVASVSAAAACSDAQGWVGQAVVRRDPAWLEAPHLLTAVDHIDAAIESVRGPMDVDVLVDDKACSYFMSSYESWGGFRQEWLANGEELLAETSRLLMAGLPDVTVVDVQEASVVHLDRRLRADACQIVGSGGFPYKSRRVFPGEYPLTLPELEHHAAEADERLEAVLDMRLRHLVALEIVLPALFAAHSRRSTADEVLQRCLDEVPARSPAAGPGEMMAAALALVWAELSSFEALLAHVRSAAN